MFFLVKSKESSDSIKTVEAIDACELSLQCRKISRMLPAGMHLSGLYFSGLAVSTTQSTNCVKKVFLRSNVIASHSPSSYSTLCASQKAAPANQNTTTFPKTTSSSFKLTWTPKSKHLFIWWFYFCRIVVAKALSPVQGKVSFHFKLIFTNMIGFLSTSRCKSAVSDWSLEGNKNVHYSLSWNAFACG